MNGREVWQKFWRAKEYEAATQEFYREYKRLMEKHRVTTWEEITLTPEETSQFEAVVARRSREVIYRAAVGAVVVGAPAAACGMLIWR